MRQEVVQPYCQLILDLDLKVRCSTFCYEEVDGKLVQLSVNSKGTNLAGNDYCFEIDCDTPAVGDHVVQCPICLKKDDKDAIGMATLPCDDHAHHHSLTGWG